MKKLWVIVVGLMVVGMAASATVVWQDDMSNATTWNLVVANTMNAWNSSDGSLGSFGVSNASSVAAWAPTTHGNIDTSRPTDYSFSYVVPTISGSMSYWYDLDGFDSGGTYVRTLGTIVSQGVFMGSNSVNIGTVLSGADWSGVYQVAPKLILSTGNGDQVMQVDNLSINDNAVVPEPSTAALMLGAGLIGLLVRKHRAA